MAAQCGALRTCSWWRGPRGRHITSIDKLREGAGPLHLDRHDQHQILDADAVFAGLVITGLVGEEHAGLERLVAAGLAAADRRDALRPLVDGEISANAVAGAVGVIEAGAPQILPR